MIRYGRTFTLKSLRNDCVSKVVYGNKIETYCARCHLEPSLALLQVLKNEQLKYAYESRNRQCFSFPGFLYNEMVI